MPRTRRKSAAKLRQETRDRKRADRAMVREIMGTHAHGKQEPPWPVFVSAVPHATETNAVPHATETNAVTQAAETSEEREYNLRLVSILNQTGPDVGDEKPAVGRASDRPLMFGALKDELWADNSEGQSKAPDTKPETSRLPKGRPPKRQKDGKTNVHEQQSQRNKFWCPYPGCPRVFALYHKLKQHKLTHRDKRFVCKYNGCQQSFKTADEQKEHQKIHVEKALPELPSSGGYPFRCPVLGCYLAFTRETTLSIHCRLKHDETEPDMPEPVRKNSDGQPRPLKCKYKFCLKFFRHKEDLRRHMKIHSDDNPYPCVFKECDLRFKYPKTLDTHIERSHPGMHEFKCKFAGCTKIYDKYIMLSRHELIHVAEKTFVCPEDGCGKKFLTALYRNSHIWKVHRGQRSHECPVCNRKFKHNYMLTKHKKIHLKGTAQEEVFSCSQCPRKLATKSGLIRHIGQVHSADVAGVCEICCKSFKRREHLANHMANAHNADDSEKLCPHCGVVTANANELKDHVQIHDKDLDGMNFVTEQVAGVTQYRCMDCDKTFKMVRYLKHHRYVHFPESHMCSICGKVFKCGKYLKDHMIVHEEHRRHECDICHKTYKTAKDMHRHRETHCETRNYACTYPNCGRMYKTQSTLRTHLKYHRRNERKNQDFQHGNAWKPTPGVYNQAQDNTWKPGPGLYNQL